MLSAFRNGCCSQRHPCPAHREIAHRYRAGGRFVFDLNSERLDELNRLAHARHGDTLPDNDEGERFAFVMTHLSDYRWRADTLASAKWLNVSYAERQALGLKTVGAFDMPKKQREALRRDRQRERKRELKRRRRRANGMRPRAEWLAAHSTSRDKPWKAAGMSRAQWYRKRNETGVGPPILPKRDSPTPVSNPPSKPRRHKRVAKEACRRHEAALCFIARASLPDPLPGQERAVSP